MRGQARGQDYWREKAAQEAGQRSGLPEEGQEANRDWKDTRYQKSLCETMEDGSEVLL
jgi:hypothetical protein